MNKIKLVGIDLAKHCYQVCALPDSESPTASCLMGSLERHVNRQRRYVHVRGRVCPYTGPFDGKRLALPNLLISCRSHRLDRTNDT